MSVEAIGINTCIGCGEFRAVPKKVKETIVKLIFETSTDKAGHPTDKDLPEIYEQLDIPYLDRKDIDGLDVALFSSSQKRTPIVVGHHNLLPQKSTRVLSYGELLNSGILREIFLSKPHPIIYLHGHIHDDPVELIRDPTNNDGGVLCISAPLITDGLNVLDVYLDDDCEPIGVDLIPWRFSATQSLSKGKTLRIPLAHGNNRLSKLSVKAREIFKYLVDSGDSAQRHLTLLAVDLSLSEEETAKHCEELHWSGLISIDHFHKSMKNWDIRLTI